MRILLATITVFFYSFSFSQEIPADSSILRIIFGGNQVEKSNTSAIPEDEINNTYNDSTTTYLISFKEKVKLGNQDLLLVVCDAPIFVQQGNTWWYRNYYYLKRHGHTWKMIKSQTDGQEMLIGEVNEFEIVDIGKDKKALVSTFLSTSNGRYEKGVYFYELSRDSVTYLLNIDLVYSNEKRKEGISEDEDCFATSFESNYEIVKSDKVWFDIKVHKTNYGYTKGCEKRVINSEEDIIYTYDGVKYNENRPIKLKSKWFCGLTLLKL